jgi:hypothetical protein
MTLDHELSLRQLLLPETLCFQYFYVKPLVKPHGLELDLEHSASYEQAHKAHTLTRLYLKCFSSSWL